MTHVVFDRDGLTVHFPSWERLMAGRATLTAAPEAITGASAEAGWSYEVLGYRSGLVVSGYRKVGVFTHPSGTRRLVSMKRGMPLLRVDVRRGITGFDQLLLSTPDAGTIARRIEAVTTP